MRRISARHLVVALVLLLELPVLVPIAVGALLSGTVLLLVEAPEQLRRLRTASSQIGWRTPRRGRVGWPVAPSTEEAR